jgi:glycosyltransferase involved in cell wall biosynthesis
MAEIRGHSLVCFSNVEWGGWKQRHHHLMERFAGANEVLFVETPGMRPPNLLSASDLKRMGQRMSRAATATLAPRRDEGGTGPLPAGLRIYSPVVIPYHRSGGVRRLNTRLLLRDLRSLLAARNMVRPILWVYLPTDLIVGVARQLTRSLLVYDCADDITEFEHAPPELAASEATLLGNADVVFASSQPLLEKCRRRNAAVHYVPNAGDVEWFARESQRAGEPPELAALPRPRVGYVGAVREWFDWELLEACLHRFPRAQFVLIGDRAAVPRLRRMENLHILGPRPYVALPGYLGALDVCIIPFRQTALIRSTHPVKVYEYLAAGKPVVSTPMEEIRHLREVDQPAGTGLFLEALGRHLETGDDPRSQDRRRLSVEGETWDRRFRSVQEALAGALERRSARVDR